jgi:N utilization substance protein A
VRQAGILETFSLEPQDAELLIMRARVVMGWIEAPEEPEPEEVEGEAELTAEDVFGSAEGPAAEAEAVGEPQDS